MTYRFVMFSNGHVVAPFYVGVNFILMTPIGLNRIVIRLEITEIVDIMLLHLPVFINLETPILPLK